MCKEFCGKESDNNFQIMSFSKADKKIPEDEEIKLAHPTRSGRHDLYAKAQELISAKHSKFALIELVTWLLLRLDKAEKNAAELSEQLAKKVDK
jgi:hypothetical protein